MREIEKICPISRCEKKWKFSYRATTPEMTQEINKHLLEEHTREEIAGCLAVKAVLSEF